MIHLVTRFGVDECQLTKCAHVSTPGGKSFSAWLTGLPNFLFFFFIIIPCTRK